MAFGWALFFFFFFFPIKHLRGLLCVHAWAWRVGDLSDGQVKLGLGWLILIFVSNIEVNNALFSYIQAIYMKHFYLNIL